MRRILVALALSAFGLAQAATVSVYTSLASWEAAISGPAQLQDFSGYANDTPLAGVAVLPGLTLSSNIDGPLHVFGANKTASAFGTTRATGTAYFEGQYALPFLAAALDITSFESEPGNPSTAVDQGVLTFWFSDGTSQDILLSGNPGLPVPLVFAGVISDHAITRFRWTEAHEASGGNEETALDNFRVAMRASELPLPGSLPLALLALGVLPLARRRR
ncbi:hypothetical protein [Roseateles asaccharophilus]|uniref:Secreted protein n=1 Tax=Roseateles asaccharophilus TaxID=582607 RepID=A0ABU2AD40_9BURK|nr:hypothetical protein [Roseateles asaccharophilus]MDR7335121.1 hypothetical protein [Roseateles asaccharophilus]